MTKKRIFLEFSMGLDMDLSISSVSWSIGRDPAAIIRIPFVSKRLIEQDY